MTNTHDKIALITGASRGIGQTILLELGLAGYTVIGTATSEQGAQKISDAIKEQNLKGRGIVLNVTDVASVNDAMGLIQSEFGHPSVLVNNAGITRDNLMLRMKEEEWQSIIDTNLSSVYRLSKACLKAMVKARWGRIINISSVVGVSGNPGQANYAAAKAGMIGFSKALAYEIATRGITVNNIAPGYIQTEMTGALNEKQQQMILSQIPMAKMGQPKDIAKTVVFLASDDASYITGQTIHVNGGMCMV